MVSPMEFVPASRPTARSHVALGLFALSGTITSAALALHLTAEAGPAVDQWGLPGFEGILAVVTGGVGYLILRSTSNPTGWIFTGLGLSSSLQYIAEEYAAAGLPPGPTLAGAVTVAWIAEWIWVPLVASIGLLLLIFPDDRIGSRPGRIIAGIGATAAATAMVGAALLSPRVVTWDVANPYAITQDAALGDSVFGISAGVMMLSLVAAAIRLIARLRRARGVRRQQLKWFVYAAAFASVSLVFSAIPATTAVGSKFAVIGVVAIAAASAVAVLRYRLYDIDLVINRTLVYVTLTVLLAGAYAGSVFLLQLILTARTDRSQMVVAVSTLAVAALFRPLRGRVQEFIDRRFDRRHYDSRITVDRLRHQIREAVDVGTLEVVVLTAVRDTVAPRDVVLWLRPR